MSSLTVAAHGFLDRWVHPEAACEPQVAARHRALVATLLALSLFGACAFPVWIAVVRRFEVADAAFFAASAMPLLIAGHLARSGDIDRAELLFTLLLAGLAVLFGLGGARVPALALLALVAIEGSLAESKRVLATRLPLAGIGLVVVWLSPPIDLAATGAEPLAMGAAGLTAIATALRIRAVHSRVAATADESEQNYRVFADAVGGLVTKHDANGEAVFASPASRSLLGAAPAELMGGRFVQRIQMPDRLAFLKAMKECVRDRKEDSIRLGMLRARRGEAGRALLETARVEMSYRPVIDGHTNEVFVIAVTRDYLQETLPAEPAKDIAALRGPLNAIVEFSALLGRQMPIAANTNALDYARLIQSSANQMLDLVNAASEPGRRSTESVAPVTGRPNGKFLSAATKTKDQIPAGRISGQKGQMKVLFPDFAHGSGKSRSMRERRSG